MGAVVGAAAGITGGPVGMAMGAQAGYGLGSAIGGGISGSENRGNASGLLGSQTSQGVGVGQGGDNNPFDAYGDQANPTGQMPSKVEGMSLPQGTEAPGGANKAALTTNDYAGYATTAMQAINAAQNSQMARDATEAKINDMKWRDPTIVHGPSYQGAQVGSGQFPTVGNGFMRY